MWGQTALGTAFARKWLQKMGSPRLLRTGFPPRACKERTSSDPFLGQWLSGV